MSDHVRLTRNRREFLTDAFCGFGSIAFGAMLSQEAARAATYNPLAPKPPHMKARAKSAIFLFLALAVYRTGDAPGGVAAARQLFAFSIVYLFGLFAALLIERGIDRLID